MPAWNDIRPSAIAAHLPLLWAWKYDAAADAFTGRLAGDAIEAIFGRSFRGATMADLFAPDENARIFARHRRVVTGPYLFHGSGVVFRHLDRFGTGERIIMPLSDSGGGCDGILGATVYDTAEGVLPDDLAEAREVEEWFELD